MADNTAEQKFTLLDDMTDEQLATVRAQQQTAAAPPRRSSLFRAHGPAHPAEVDGLMSQPYQDLGGRWRDGSTDQPLSRDELGRWGIRP